VFQTKAAEKKKCFPLRTPFLQVFEIIKHD